MHCVEKEVLDYNKNKNLFCKFERTWQVYCLKAPWDPPVVQITYYKYWNKLSNCIVKKTNQK